MKVLVISGSTRPDSYNTRLAQLVVRACPEHDVTVVTQLAALPFFDQTVEAQGWPEPVAELRTAVAGADVVVVVTPEYNGSHPGVLANAVDWVSRPYGRSPLRGKATVIVSASPGQGAGRRAAAHLGAVLASIGAAVQPDGLAVGRADEALADDAAMLESLREVLGRVTDRRRSDPRADAAA